MKRLAALLFLVISATAFGEHTRLTNPNALVGGLLGRGLLFSVGYDRVMNDDLAAGLGLGLVSTSISSVAVIPAYVNYYISRDQGSLFGTVGVSIIAGTAAGQQSKVGSVTLPSSNLMPTFGIGYENRGDSGFLFRAEVLAVIATTVLPWVGFEFGYAF